MVREGLASPPGPLSTKWRGGWIPLARGWLGLVNAMAARERLDRLLVARGLVPSREQAQRLIYAGEVRVDGAVGRAPAQLVSPTADLQVQQPPPFVSRGGEKLTHALDVFAVDVTGRVCLDVGASTGGFTDALLQRGAAACTRST